MKKTSNIISLIVIGILLLSTCNFKPKESIQIKAKPKIRFNMGEKPVEFTAKKITEFIGKKATDPEFSQKYKILDYIDGTDDDTKKLLFCYRVTDIDLDPKDFLKGLQNTINKDLGRKEFKVPNISELPEISSPIPTDMFKLGDMISLPSINQTLNIPMKPPTPITQTIPSEAIALTGCTSLTLDTGSSLNLKSTLPAGVAIKSIILYHYPNNSKTKLTEWISGVGPDPASIDLANKKIQNKISFAFVIEISDAVNGNVSITPKFSNNTSVLEISGINKKIDVPVDQSMPLSSYASKFQSAEIESGNLELTVKTPASWKNFKIDYTSLKMKQEKIAGDNGLDLTLSNKKISLDNKNINSNDLKISGTLKINVENGTYRKENAPKIKFTPKINLKKFKSVKIKTPNFNPEINCPTKLPSDVAKWIDEIIFKEEIIKIKIKNNLPEGNNLKINLSSDDIVDENSGAKFDEEVNVTSGGEAQTFKIPSKVTKLTNAKIKDNKLDFKATVGFDGYDKATGLLTIKNVSLSPAPETYFFEVSIAVDPKWKSAKINPNASGLKFENTYPGEGSENVDLTKVKKFLDKGISLNGDIKARIYIASPSLGKKDIELDAQAYIEGYDKDGKYDSNWDLLAQPMASSPKDTIPTPKAIKILKNLPESLLKGNDDYVYDKKSSGALPNASIECTLNDLFDPKKIPSSIKFHYSIGCSKAIEITEADLGDKIKIKAAMVFEVPLSVKIEGKTDIPESNGKKGILIKEIPFTNDIMGRKDKNSTANQDEDKDESLTDSAMKSIKELSLNIKYTNTLGLNVTAIITASSNGKKLNFNKHIKLEDGKNKKLELKLSQKEIMLVKDTFPFTPKIEIYIPNHPDYSVKNNAKLKANFSFLASFDIDQTFPKGGK